MLHVVQQAAKAIRFRKAKVMYPEELTLAVDPSDSRERQLVRALAHASAQELRAALETIEHCVSQLTVDQIWWRPDESLNSIGNLALHLTGNLRQWVGAGLGGATDSRDRPREFSERGPLPTEDLLRQIREAVADAQAILSKIDADELLRPRQVQGFQVSGVAALCHAVAHFRGHTQEIVSLTRQQLGPRYRFAWVPKTAEQGA